MPHAERVHATIDRTGKIFFNQKLHNMMGRPQAIFLYFNRPKDMIILEPAMERTASNAFTLREGNGGARLVYASPFFRHFGIRPDGTLRFLTPETDSDGRLYLKLQETITVTRGPRTKR